MKKKKRRYTLAWGAKKTKIKWAEKGKEVKTVWAFSCSQQQAGRGFSWGSM